MYFLSECCIHIWFVVPHFVQKWKSLQSTPKKKGQVYREYVHCISSPVILSLQQLRIEDEEAALPKLTTCSFSWCLESGTGLLEYLVWKCHTQDHQTPLPPALIFAEWRKPKYHKSIRIYLECHSVCPLVRIGTPPPPLPQARVSPPCTKGGGGDTLGCGSVG